MAATGGTTLAYFLHGLLLNATWVPVLKSATPAMNVEFTKKRGGAAVTLSFVGAAKAAPSIPFTTTAIKTILDACSAGDGVSIASFEATNCDLCFRRADAFGSREAINAGNALIVRADTAALVWNSIEAGEDEATIECEVHPTYDGTNLPLIGLGSQNIAAHQNVGDVFALGPCKVNGNFLDGVTRWQLAQNLELIKKFGSGNAYPTFVALKSTAPVLTVDTPDLDQWVTTHMGLQCTALIAFLRKLNPDVIGPIAEASAFNISLTATDNPCGMILPGSSSGGIDDAASVSMEVHLRRSVATTTHPLTVDTTAAIA